MQTRNPTVLETHRLTLRVFDIDDVDALVSVHGDPDVMRYSTNGPKTIYQIKQFIENAREHHWREGYSQWAIIWKPTGHLIGECGIWLHDIVGFNEHEISYRLNSTFWNRGIATEAVIACRDFAFGTLGFDRVISIIDPQNEASISVARKVGMLPQKNAVFHGIPVVIYGVGRPA